MRHVLVFVLVAGSWLVAGCQKYVELHTNGDRIWLLTKDATEVYRCFDTADKNGRPTRDPAVFCKRAVMYDQGGSFPPAVDKD